MSISVHMVDVFGSDAISGNPLAVIVAVQTLAAEEIQRLMRGVPQREQVTLVEFLAGAAMR